MSSDLKRPDRRLALQVMLATGMATGAGSLSALGPAAGSRDPSRQALNDFTPPGSGSSPERDWDWLVGRWKVKHRKLKERLVGSDDWMTFEGTCENWPLINGSGNVDDNYFDSPEGAYAGVGLRAFDPVAGSWAIWWLDSRNPARLDVPVRGGFKDGVGVFLADDTWNGTPVKVRFRWSQITAMSALWDQAFSADGGEHWEPNWYMSFERVPGTSASG